MRKALIVGVDEYKSESIRNLTGCVADAQSVCDVLARHHDGTLNFQCDLRVAKNHHSPLGRRDLRERVQRFFEEDAEAGLFYFAGHGLIESTGGYLQASDAETASDGLALSDLVHWVNQSPIRHKLVILDCCHSGAMAAPAGTPDVATLGKNVTVLTASTERQLAAENHGSGLFTGLMVEALKGAAANITGEVSPASVYAFIDQSLSAFQQRPMFKSNVQQFISLRNTQPKISLSDLHRITEFFPAKDDEHALDPSYEKDPSPEHLKDDYKGKDPVKVEIFRILQRYNRLNLLVPIGEDDMYFAAMNSTGCRLTPLGQHYWRLVQKKLV